jgi:hypothetical protein
MKYLYTGIFLLGIAGCLVLNGCSKDTVQSAADKGPQPIGDPAVAKQLQTASTRMEEVAFEMDSLKGKLDKVDKLQEKVESLERDLAILRSALNEVEKRPIPAPVKKTDVKSGLAKSDKPPEKIAVAEPVPTGGGTEGNVDQEDLEGENPKEGEDNPETGEVGVEGVDGEALPANFTPGLIAVVNMKFATGLDRETRTPTNEGTVFKAGENRLYCWLVLSNEGEDETTATLHWKHEGKEVSKIELKVGKKTSHWRTWAYIRPHPAGVWEAEIRDLGGNVVGTGSFTIE